MPDKYFIVHTIAPRAYNVEVKYTYKSNDSEFVEDREVLIETLTYKEICQLTQLLSDFGFIDLTEEI